MNPLLSAALVAPLLFAPEVTLTFIPEEGVTVALTIEQTSEAIVTAESYCPIVEGERVEDEAESNEGGSNWSFELECVVVDTYDAVEDGMVTGLTRTFESISGDSAWELETEDGLEEDEFEIGSPLAGRTVSFSWDDRSEEYTASFESEGDDSDVDAILLDDMKLDAFGDWFLPEDDGEEISEGDEWSPGIDAWNDFLEVGGEFWIGIADADLPTDEAAEKNRSLEVQLRDNMEGEVLCTFEGLREVDGVDLGVIRISIEVTTNSNVDSSYEFEDEGTIFDVESNEVTEIELTGEGECLWNLEANRPHSIRFETETAEVSRSTESIETEDGTYGTYGMESVTETEISGVVVYRFEVR